MLTTTKTATGLTETTMSRTPQSLIQSVADAIYEAAVRRALKGISSRPHVCA